MNSVRGPLSGQIFRVLLALTLTAVAFGSQASEPLRAAVNLRSDGEAARRARLPVVLFFYSRTCPYCREVEENYLRPLLADNMKIRRFVFAAVEVGSSADLIDFHGQKTTMQDFARSSGVAVVPFIRFVGSDGVTVAADIVGLTTRDFYAGYSEESLQRGLEKLNTQ